MSRTGRSIETEDEQLPKAGVGSEGVEEGVTVNGYRGFFLGGG